MEHILHFDRESLLVLTHKGVIRRLYCPFLVKCIQEIDGLQEESVCYVDEIFDDPDFLILYKICGNLYAYDNFLIQMVFD